MRYAIGEGTVIPFMGGKARIKMTAHGNGVLAALGIGAGRMKLTSEDHSMNAVASLGDGTATMALDAQHGIPANTIVADGHEAAETLHVDSDRSPFVVPAGKPMAVPSAGGPMRVSREGGV